MNTVKVKGWTDFSVKEVFIHTRCVNCKIVCVCVCVCVRVCLTTGSCHTAQGTDTLLLV